MVKYFHLKQINSNMLNNNGVHWSVHESYLIILRKIKQKNHKENFKEIKVKHN